MSTFHGALTFKQTFGLCMYNLYIIQAFQRNDRGQICQSSKLGLISTQLRTNSTKSNLGQRHVNLPPIDHSYKCHQKHQAFTCFRTIQAPNLTDKLKYVSTRCKYNQETYKYIAHPRPVVPTNSGHPKYVRQ